MSVRAIQRRAGGAKAAERIRIPIPYYTYFDIAELASKTLCMHTLFPFFHIARWVLAGSEYCCRMNIYMCYDMLCVLCAQE